MTDFWTDDRITQLTQLWADGDTCSQIGSAMGCSRNAVIGKIHRLRLPERLRPPPMVARARPKRLYARAYPTVRYREMPEETVVTNARESPCSLLELNNTRCRWPVGDPQEAGFHFCGGSVGRAPYCTFHSRIAHQGPVSPRDRRPFRLWSAA